MAYTAYYYDCMPVPTEPGVLSIRVPNSADEINFAVYVPWTNCRLAHAETVCTEAIDATGHMEIDLLLDSSSGSEMMTITVDASSSVGDVDYATVTDASLCNKLDRGDTARDAVNVEVDGSSGATGSVMLYLYFERDRD